VGILLGLSDYCTNTIAASPSPATIQKLLGGQQEGTEPSQEQREKTAYVFLELMKVVQSDILIVISSRETFPEYLSRVKILKRARKKQLHQMRLYLSRLPILEMLAGLAITTHPTSRQGNIDLQKLFLVPNGELASMSGPWQQWYV
jgi:hypothetical protein